MKPDLFEAPDYYLLDELLTEEHKLIRDAARAWVKRDVSPIIEEAAQKAEFPKSIIPGLAEIGAFGPYIPVCIFWLRIGWHAHWLGRMQVSKPQFSLFSVQRG